jgi:ribosome biogenesis GTPase A
MNLGIPDEDKENEEKEKLNDKIDNEDNKRKTRNVIIKFGEKNVNCLIDYMNTISKTYLPQIAIVTDKQFNEVEEGLYDNRYLTIIKERKNDLVSTIYQYLWEKECYYNERGCAQINSVLNDDKIYTNNYINIMVTGISRSGKSTLINILSEKLVTLESPFLESVTNKIREYEIITTKNGIYQSGIRFYDTPGLTIIKDKKRNTVDEVKDAINKKIEQCIDAKDDIHLLYFLLQGDSNLENYVDFFKFIININKSRIENGKKKINIIFIFNKN